MHHLLEIMGEKRLPTSVQARNLTLMANDELYDTENDPFQTVNLVGNEKYQRVLEELQQSLAD